MEFEVLGSIVAVILIYLSSIDWFSIIIIANCEQVNGVMTISLF
jgi:hypothetical protein